MADRASNRFRVLPKSQLALAGTQTSQMARSTLQTQLSRSAFKNKSKALWAKAEDLFKDIRLLESEFSCPRRKKTRLRFFPQVFARYVKLRTLGLWKLELCNLASLPLTLWISSTWNFKTAYVASVQPEHDQGMPSSGKQKRRKAEPAHEKSVVSHTILSIFHGHGGLNLKDYRSLRGQIQLYLFPQRLDKIINYFL